MTPLEQLEQGIKLKDWNLIYQGFEGLTGRNIAPVSSEIIEDDMSFSRMIEAHDAEDYKILEPFFRQASQKSVHETPKLISPEPEERPDFSIRRNREEKNKQILSEHSEHGEDKKICRKEQIDLSKSKINLFHDDQESFQEDTAIQKKITGKPVKRSPKYKPTQVTCSTCQKTFEVNPIFARENYRCDRCILRSK